MPKDPMDNPSSISTLVVAVADPRRMQAVFVFHTSNLQVRTFLKPVRIAMAAQLNPAWVSKRSILRSISRGPRESSLKSQKMVESKKWALILSLVVQKMKTRRMILSTTKIWMMMRKMPQSMRLRHPVVNNSQPQVKRLRRSAVASLNHFIFNNSRSKSDRLGNRPSFANKSFRMQRTRKRSS
jgi:hypothetical protein